ncbi:thioredoxin family protein [uncultured Sphaerochaeta sp.]|uniref:peroxiredoxin family protein n=1 Tax=uncultured Sphaerochaeta sp. TaxID=886478 RepID=UPI002A0A9A8D|nr:thioredoxin family protein [uncultured Sphaerochaeta sp.]
MKRFVYLLPLVFILSSCTIMRAPQQGERLFSTVLKGSCSDLEGNEVTVSSDYYLIYYAADWCPYCQAYSEQLKQTYASMKRKYGNVEIVFAGHERDISNENLVSFMKQGNYPFPYVKFSYRSQTGIMHLFDVPKFWIPGFVLLDRYGKVLSSSNGLTKDDYSRDRPLRYYEAIQQCDCLLEKPKL